MATLTGSQLSSATRGSEAIVAALRVQCDLRQASRRTSLDFRQRNPYNVAFVPQTGEMAERLKAADC